MKATKLPILSKPNKEKCQSGEKVIGDGTR